MMFMFDVSIRSFVVFRGAFFLDRFVIGIFNVCSSSVLMIMFDWTLKGMRNCGRLRGNITAACAGNAEAR